MVFLKIRFNLYHDIAFGLAQTYGFILLFIEYTNRIEAICAERIDIAARLRCTQSHVIGFIQSRSLIGLEL